MKTPLDSSNISQSEQPRGFGTIHKTANGEDAGTMEVVDEVSEFDDDESVKRYVRLQNNIGSINTTIVSSEFTNS